MSQVQGSKVYPCAYYSCFRNASSVRWQLLHNFETSSAGECCRECRLLTDDTGDSLSLVRGAAVLFRAVDVLSAEGCPFFSHKINTFPTGIFS